MVTLEQKQYIRTNYETKKSKDIANHLNLSKSTVDYWGRTVFGIKKQTCISRAIYNFNYKYFDNIAENQSYFLGLLMADGYVYKKRVELLLSEKDIELVENFKKQLNSEHPIKICNRTRKGITNSYSYISLENKYFSDRLKSLGVIERRTGFEKFPKECLEYKYHFLRGLIDGDGTVYYRKEKPAYRGVSIVSASQSFLNEIRNVFDIGQVYTKDTIFNWAVYKKKDLLELYNNLYNNTSLYLNRKFIKYNELISIC